MVRCSEFANLNVALVEDQSDEKGNFYRAVMKRRTRAVPHLPPFFLQISRQIRWPELYLMNKQKFCKAVMNAVCRNGPPRLRLRSSKSCWCRFPYISADIYSLFLSQNACFCPDSLHVRFSLYLAFFSLVTVAASTCPAHELVLRPESLLLLPNSVSENSGYPQSWWFIPNFEGLHH